MKRRRRGILRMPSGCTRWWRSWSIRRHRAGLKRVRREEGLFSTASFLLLCDAAARRQIHGKGAEPVGAFIVLAGNGSQAGAAMGGYAGLQGFQARVVSR